MFKGDYEEFTKYGAFISSADKLLNQDSTNTSAADDLLSLDDTDMSAADDLLSLDDTDMSAADDSLSLDDTDLSVPDDLLSLDSTNTSAADDLLSLDDIDMSAADDLLSLGDTDMSAADDLLSLDDIDYEEPVDLAIDDIEPPVISEDGSDESLNLDDIDYEEPVDLVIDDIEPPVISEDVLADLLNLDSDDMGEAEEINHHNGSITFITANAVAGYEETREVYVFLKKVLLGYVDDEGNCDKSFKDIEKDKFLSKIDTIYITGGDAAYFEEPSIFTVGIYTKKLRILNMIQAIIYTPQGYPVRSITDTFASNPIIAKIKGDIERGLFPK